MKFEEFKKEFDQILDSMSEQELIGAFEKLGCEFEDIIQEDEAVNWCPEHANYSIRSADPSFVIDLSVCSTTSAADSNELALAA